MRILVTGAAGFIGSSVMKALIARDHRVVGVDDLSFGSEENLSSSLFYKMKYQDIIIGQTDVIVHLATSNIIYSIVQPVLTFKNNAEGSLELFKRFSGKIVNISTSSVYGNPAIIPTPEIAPINTTNAYDTSKRVAELYLQHRRNYTTLRLTNVYGHGQLPFSPYCGVVSKLLEKAIDGGVFVIFGDKKSTRDYTYVDDVVEAIVSAAERPAYNTEINIGTGIETSTEQLIDWVKAITHNNFLVKYADARTIDNVQRRCLDIEKAALYLDWSPKTKLLEGLQLTKSWLEMRKVINI